MPASEVPSVHCPGLLDVRGASQNVVKANTEVVPGKLKVIHSVITRSESQSVLLHRVLQKLNSVVLGSLSLWLV
jgi:hypothetical protein